MLDEFFPAFLEFFFPEIERDIDWSRGYESLDKELAQIKPDLPGGTLYADKLFKVWLRNGEIKWILIHVEIQGRAGRKFSRRMFVYNYRIGEKYPGADIVSLAVVTETKQPVEGRYEVTNWGCSLVFKFPIVQLAGYAKRWTELEADSNPFAVAVMAQLKALETRRDNRSRFTWKRQLVLGLYERGYDRQRIVALFKFMDWVMKLPKELEEIIRQKIHDLETGKQMPYVTSIERLGMEEGLRQGMAKGLQQGLQEALLSTATLQLSHRLGELSKTVESKLQKLSPEHLQALVIALLDFETKSDLLDWLKQHAPANGSKQKQNGKQTKRKQQ